MNIMTSQYSELPADAPVSQVSRERATISCVICQALYTLAPSYEYLLQTQPILLESTFMSTCHFCFRCRRPACSGCWDGVHGVCGACGQEAHLPFRITLPPLHGVLFTPPRQVQPGPRRPSSDLLVCVRLGRFESDAPPPLDVLPTRPGVPAVTMSSMQLPETRGEAQNSAQPETLTSFSMSALSQHELLDDEQTLSSNGRMRRIVLIIIGSTLLLVGVLLLLALLFANVNMLIAHTLHVDIRAAIAYLLLLIRRLL